MATDKQAYELEAGVTRVILTHGDAEILIEGSYSTADPAIKVLLDEHPALKRAETSSAAARSTSSKE